MSSDLRDITIGFVGAGQMAGALAQGWQRQQLVEGKQLLAYDVSIDSLRNFAAQVAGSRAADSAAALAHQSNLIVLAVKPASAEEALSALHAGLRASHLVISIVAGLETATLSRLAMPARIIRVMPNTPCLVGLGATAFCRGPRATPEDAAVVTELFRAVGSCHEVPESYLDVVTALSGSGPAFTMLFLEGMVDGAVKMGLPRELALELAGQTVLGTAKMLLQEKVHPAILRDRIASPGGTTMAGLHALEKAAVRGAAISAIEAATDQARCLRKPPV